MCPYSCYPPHSDNWEGAQTQRRQTDSCPSVHQTVERFEDGACGLAAGLVAGRTVQSEGRCMERDQWAFLVPSFDGIGSMHH